MTFLSVTSDKSRLVFWEEMWNRSSSQSKVRQGFRRACPHLSVSSPFSDKYQCLTEINREIQIYSCHTAILAMIANSATNHLHVHYSQCFLFLESNNAEFSLHFPPQLTALVPCWLARNSDIWSPGLYHMFLFLTLSPIIDRTRVSSLLTLILSNSLELQKIVHA